MSVLQQAGGQLDFLSSAEGVEGNFSMMGNQVVDGRANGSNGSGLGNMKELQSKLGISLSTPIIMMSFGVLGNLLALLVLFTAEKQVGHVQ
jgi:hypothetical protein